MDRDLAIKLVDALLAIKADLDEIVTNTTPADDTTPAEETGT